MSRANGSTPPADDRPKVQKVQKAQPVSNTRALEQSKELSRQIADLAERIADSEDMVAATLEESARLRPHAEERLRSAAAEARRFAEVERDHSRKLRRAAEGPDTDPPTG